MLLAKLLSEKLILGMTPVAAPIFTWEEGYISISIYLHYVQIAQNTSEYNYMHTEYRIYRIQNLFLIYVHTCNALQ